MGSKKKERLARESSNYRVGIIAITLSFVSLAISCIGIIPTVQILSRKPQLSLTRSKADTTTNRVIVEYEIANKGDAIATDIFIAMETYEDDVVDLFFGINGAIERNGKDCRVTISSLAPNETTSLIIISYHKNEYVAFATEMGKLPRWPNIHSVDFREGAISDVERD